jgi:hypothetical protein
MQPTLSLARLKKTKAKIKIKSSQSVEGSYVTDNRGMYVECSPMRAVRLPDEKPRRPQVLAQNGKAMDETSGAART